MPVTPFDAAGIAAACLPRLAELTDSLERCFEGIGVLEPGESRAWETAPEAFFGAGIVVRIETSGGTILGLIPASFPLPEWHLAPNETEQARLAALAVEWAEQLAPAETTIERTKAEPIDDLIAAVTTFASESSYLVALNPEGCEGDTLRTIYMLACPARKEAAPKPAPALRPDASPRVTESPRAPAESRREPSDDPRRARLDRVLNVPVQVAVRLAEKRIELDQLLTLAPGSLISFDKNCEDLLDLYVNNRLFGRGEAVKIGEHFGLKIDEVGSVKRREERVF